MTFKVINIGQAYKFYLAGVPQGEEGFPVVQARLRQINNGVFIKLNKATINMLRICGEWSDIVQEARVDECQLELESIIFESLFQRRMLKAP